MLGYQHKEHIQAIQEQQKKQIQRVQEHHEEQLLIIEERERLSPTKEELTMILRQMELYTHKKVSELEKKNKNQETKHARIVATLDKFVDKKDIQLKFQKKISQRDGNDLRQEMKEVKEREEKNVKEMKKEKEKGEMEHSQEKEKVEMEHRDEMKKEKERVEKNVKDLKEDMKTEKETKREREKDEEGEADGSCQTRYL